MLLQDGMGKMQDLLLWCQSPLVVWKSGDKLIFEQQSTTVEAVLQASFLIYIYNKDEVQGVQPEVEVTPGTPATWSLPAGDVIKISFGGTVQRFLLEIRRQILRN